MLIRLESILKYPILSIQTAHSMMIPVTIQYGIEMKLSEIEDMTEREQNKLLTQKRVTSNNIFINELDLFLSCSYRPK
jgi:hypothetical protein